MGRKPGEALCRERYDEKALAGIREDVGPGPWASLYQQRPVPLGGGMFRKEWFDNRYREIVTSDGELVYQLGDRIVRSDNLWKFSTMDTAYTRNLRSDYTVACVWGVAPTDPVSLMLLDVKRVRVEHHEHSTIVRDIWDQWKPSWIGIEKINATLSLFSEVQRQGVVVRWLTPDKNKIARAETAAAVASSNRLWLPQDADWLPDWLEEHVTFPVAAHDDQVDNTSYACNELVNRTVRPRHEKQEATTPSDKMWERLRQRERSRTQHPTLGRFP